MGEEIRSSSDILAIEEVGSDEITRPFTDEEITELRLQIARRDRIHRLGQCIARLLGKKHKDDS